ncbi:endonuclease V isoform X3 [Candoia aspera]|uniref:endonuclease V isoform X3 n=1 Tax=Candoia aspera TaxID=51853 RepID=UPI002FD7E17D
MADRMGTTEEERENLRRWERQQIQMKEDVIEQDTEEWQSNFSFTGLRRVGGMDLSYLKDATRACASLVVLSYPDLEVLYNDCSVVAVNAPYVAGFLAFREVPFLLEAVQRLETQEPSLMPQVLLVDGNGILHHRGFGIACHLGVLTSLPCVGVAKNLLQVDGLANDELHKKQHICCNFFPHTPDPRSSGWRRCVLTLKYLWENLGYGRYKIQRIHPETFGGQLCSTPSSARERPRSKKCQIGGS